METEYIVFFLTIFVTSLIFAKKWKERKQPSHSSPPSLPSLPIVGSLPFLRGFDNIPKFFMEKSRELGPIFTFRIVSKLVLTLNNREAIEEALVKNSRTFSSRPTFFMQNIINPRGKGIGFRDSSPEWKRIQKNSLAVLREFGFGDKNIMEERILKEVQAMDDFGRKTGGKPFDPRELFLLVTSNIIMSILFGSRRDFELGISELVLEIDRYAHLMDMIFDIAPFLRFIPPFKNKISNISSCCKNMHDILEREISKSLQSNKKSFVSEFVKREGPGYDRENLCFVLRDLIAGGSDTTTNTMTWAMIAFANHPEIQKKLQEEIDSVISRDRFPTMQDQPKLPYVEATIHEIFRWRTLVPLSLAHFTIQDSIVNDFLIPAETMVLPNLYAVHNDITVWKDPDVFRPERFLDKENNVFGLDRLIAFSLDAVKTAILSPPLSIYSPGTLVACLSDGNPSPSYKWQIRKLISGGKSENWRDMLGETDKELSVNIATYSFYRCVARNTIRGSSYVAISETFQVNYIHEESANSTTMGMRIAFFFIGVFCTLLLISFVVFLLKLVRCIQFNTNNRNPTPKSAADVDQRQYMNMDIVRFVAGAPSAAQTVTPSTRGEDSAMAYEFLGDDRVEQRPYESLAARPNQTRH